MAGRRQDTDPLEATYRATPADVERAIERTGAKYVADMAVLYDRVNTEVGRLYEGQLAAKDEALAAQQETITMQGEALAEMREQLRAERIRTARAEANAEMLERFYDPGRWGDQRRAQYHREREAHDAADDDRAGDEAPTWWTRLRARLRPTR